MTTGTRYSYTDTTAQKRSVADLIFMLDWTKAPLLNVFGFTSANLKKLKPVAWPNVKLEWIQDRMSPFETTIAEALADNDTGVDVATGKGEYFRKGDIVQVDSEYMLVTAVAADELTVTRGYGGSSAAAHDTASEIEIVTRAMPEGADYTTGHTTTRSLGYNYTQILSEAAQVSRTQQRMSQYGIKEELDYQVAKLFNDGGSAGKLAMLLQKTFYHSLRVQRSSGSYGSMGGFKSFVTTNVQSLGGVAVQRSHIHTAIRNIRQAGGEATHLVTGAWGIEKITAMYEDLIRTTRDEKRGGSEITMVKTPHGEVELVYDWMCPDGEFYFTNEAKLGWLPFDEFKAEEMAKRGDFYVKDVVGEFTFFLVNEESHALITGAATDK